MGREKSRMIEADERGWNEPDGFVCPNCVEDEFLKKIIRENVCQRECDFCGHRTRSHSAAPVVVLMEPIARAVFYYFNNPTDANVPYESSEGGWFLDPTDTSDVLESLGLDCHPDLFEEIAKSFVYGEWVETADGIWTGSHAHEEMSYEWERFTRIVKYELRYFFDHARSSSIDDEYEPAAFLPTIGRLVTKLNLTEIIYSGTLLFRARPMKDSENWPLDAKQLGAPPSDKASAGRMNPAGISYLYLAFDRVTTLAEIQHGQSDRSAIGQFEVINDLRVLNLIRLPNLPSIFDDERRDDAEALIFLASFIKEIKKPVEKNGSEHVEYVPTQVVSEYFALVFELKNGERLDGILYPSAVNPSGRNLVLFPTERGYKRKFDQVEFIDALIT
jgi:RES domain-containing protein